MSTLTKAERDKLPESSFADPSRRLFPILDQADLDSAAHLIGKAKDPAMVKSRAITIAKKLNLTLPDAWKMGAKMAAEFAVETSARRVEGDYAIYPNALLFEAGDYPDKSYSMSPEEMWAAVEQFQPVGGNIEHTDFLQGRACEVRSIRLDDADPFTLRGEVAVPVWLDDNISDRERRLSCEWDRETKTLSGIGLVVNPRVETASLMTAFAEFAAKRHDTPHGQMALQQVHDVAARSGAVCSQGNAQMASRHEATKIQAAHDLAVSGGAKCASLPAGKDGAIYPMFGAGSESVAATPAPKKEGKRMGNFEKFMQWITAENGAAEAVTEGQAAAGTAAMAAAADQKPADAAAQSERERDQAEISRLRAANERLVVERITTEATNFADAQIRDGRAFPAEREAIVSAFTQASIDDSRVGAVTFSDGKTTCRVEMLKATYAARPAHQLTVERLHPGLQALFNQNDAPQTGDEAPSKEKLAELVGMTALGRTVQAAKNGTHTN